MIKKIHSVHAAVLFARALCSFPIPNPIFHFFSSIMTLLVITIFSFLTFTIFALYKDTKLKKAYHLPAASKSSVSHTIHFKKASLYDIDLIRKLALQIWPQTFEKLVTPQQLIAMLNTKFSRAALVSQLNNKVDFYIIFKLDKPVGFLSISMNEKICSLHKLYVIPDFQGEGIGMEALQHIIHLSQKQQQNKVILHIHILNPAIAFYEKAGFSIAGFQKRKVDNGSYVTEIRMELSIKEKFVALHENKKTIANHAEI